ncbi:MAG: hypothetical protein ACTSVV_03815, partial [Promethearchaeota archaeon]
MTLIYQLAPFLYQPASLIHLYILFLVFTWSLIHDLHLGKEKGRENDKDITLFKSVGIAVQDVSVAKKVLD